MKLSWLSFALLWAFKLGAADAYVESLTHEAVPAELSSRPPRPEIDDIQRYFLPGSAKTLPFPKLAKLIGKSSLQAIKEELYFGVADPQRAWHARAMMQRLQEADEREGLFLELDLRSDWQREELAGRVKTRVDFFPGGQRKKSEVSYDSSGRRIHERRLDQGGQSIFERRWRYTGPGAVAGSMQVLEANGVTVTSVAWVLNSKGLPLEEDHTDFQGLPLLHRSYRYDQAGRLANFKETKGARIRGLRYEWDYDGQGHLKERRAYSDDTLEPVWITQFDVDYKGSVVERRELFDRLPLRGNKVTGFGFDPRRDLKYRWHFGVNQANFYWKRRDGEGNESFFDARRRYKIHAQGWLKEIESLDKDSMLLSREFWNWEKSGHLTRHDLWGKPGEGAVSLRFDYEFDEQGNWIVLRPFGATEPLERTFEYYQD